jgi:hypothetical protein
VVLTPAIAALVLSKTALPSGSTAVRCWNRPIALPAPVEEAARLANGRAFSGRFATGWW